MSKITKAVRAKDLRRQGWTGRGNHWTHPDRPALVASLAAAERLQARALEHR